jgi:gamma-glutamyltranspeptidase/glutathione hydrolase
MRSILWLLSLLLLAGCAAEKTAHSGEVNLEKSAAPVPAPLPSAKPAARGARGMVAAAHPEAVEAGLAILAAGGNAFDAAIAVAAALNVVEPMNSGVGGYGTTLIYVAGERQVFYLNSSGRLPSGTRADDFRPPAAGWEANRKGAKAVSTPGNARAWELLHRRWGSLPWERLFAPAIAAAENGYPLTVNDAEILALAFADFPPAAQEIYGRGGKSLAAGERLVQAELGGTLRRLAAEGADAIHEGAIARAIGEEMARRGGFLAAADLAANEAEVRPPIELSYRGVRVLTASPPATSYSALYRLGLMERMGLGSLPHNGVEHLHRFAELSKLGFAVRIGWAGDPDVSPPKLGELLSPARLAADAAGIDLAKARPYVPPGPPPQASQHTTHFVVADAAGNVVSATQTLGNLFGSRILVPGTGIWLNNSLAYATFEPPGNPMDAHAGRHKLSGDCPAFLFRGDRLWVALGTPGGHTIDQTVPQVVSNLLDFGMGLEEAVAAPRIAFAEPDTLQAEQSLPAALREALAARGHKLKEMRRIGNVHALAIEYGADGRPTGFVGAADPRVDGLARGLD